MAYRLVLGARAVAYGEKNVSFQGPFPTHAVLKQDLICIVFNQGINQGQASTGDVFFEVRSPSNTFIQFENYDLKKYTFKQGPVLSLK